MIDKSLYIGFENRRTEEAFEKLRAASQLNICLLNKVKGVDNEVEYIIHSLVNLAMNPPSCNVGHYHVFPLVAASIALAKKQPDIWNELDIDIQERLALIMKTFAYGSAFITRCENKYMTGPDFRGNVYKGWSPNYRLSLFPQLIYCADFFGGKEELDSILINFSYDAFIAELDMYDFSLAKELWTTPSPVFEDGTPTPSIKQLLEEGGDAYITDQFGNILYANGGQGIRAPYSYRDKFYLLPDVVKMIKFCYDGGAVQSKVDIDGDGTFDAYIIDGTSSPVEGQEGMFSEFNQNTNAGAKRSSVKYCAIDFMLATSLIETSKYLGYYDLAQSNPDIYALTIVGNIDLFYKAEHGYHGLGLTVRADVDEQLCNLFGYGIWKQYWLNNNN